LRNESAIRRSVGRILLGDNMEAEGSCWGQSGSFVIDSLAYVYIDTYIHTHIHTYIHTYHTPRLIRRIFSRNPPKSTLCLNTGRCRVLNPQ
jgi:hypothetical protein